MTAPLLMITDGTTEVHLIGSETILKLRDWQPARAPSRVVWRQSALLDGRHPVAANRENMTDRLLLNAQHVSQDLLIQVEQDLEMLLEKAREYWLEDWATEPVWLAARAPNETNTRYSVIVDYQLSKDPDPYGTPFFDPGDGSGINDWELQLEHTYWAEDPPGVQNVIEQSTEHTYPVYSTPLVRRIQLNGDNAWITTGVPGVVGYTGQMVFGKQFTPDATFYTGLRFANIPIPAGAVIHKAWIRVHAVGVGNSPGVGASFTTRIKTERQTYPRGNFPSYADLLTRLTSNCYSDYIEWSLPFWELDRAYETPDLTALIQENVDDASWVSGNALVFFLTPDPDQNDTGYHRFKPANKTYSPELHIIYSAPSTTTILLDADTTSILEDKYMHSSLLLGYDSRLKSMDMGLRFQGVSIPAGAKVLSAVIELTPNSTGGTGQRFEATIEVERIASARSAFSTYAEYAKRQWHPTQVKWDVPKDVTAGVSVQTSDLSALVQLLVDESGYSDPSNLVFRILAPDDLLIQNFRNYRSMPTWAAGYAPRLIVSYASVERGGGQSASNSVWIANRHTRGNLTHLFRYDASLNAFSANLLDLTPPYALLPDPPDIDDCLYVGCAEKPDYAPFASIVFNLETAGAYPDVTVGGAVYPRWEYQEAVWPDSPVWHEGEDVTDGTDCLRQAGINTVWWDQENEWEETTINGVHGWWARLIVSTVHSPSASVSPSISQSPSRSPSPSGSPSPSASWSPSATPSSTASPSRSPSASHTASPSVSHSASPSVSPSGTHSLSASESPSRSPSVSHSASPSPSLSPSASRSPSSSESPSASPSTEPMVAPVAAEHPYTVIWNYTDIAAEQVPGTLPALLKVGIENFSGLLDDPGDRGSYAALGWMMIGSRRLERGADFSSILNCSEENLPPGVDFYLEGRTAFRPEGSAPSGQIAMYAPFESHDFAVQMGWKFGREIANQYRGLYHAYLRIGLEPSIDYWDEGTSTLVTYNATEGDIELQVAITALRAETSHWVSPIYTVPAREPGDRPEALLDLGALLLWPVQTAGGEVLEDLIIELYLRNLVDEPRMVYIRDLVLMPADEWLGFAEVGMHRTGIYYVAHLDGLRLTIDSVGLTKNPFRAYTATTSGVDATVYPAKILMAREAVLQPKKEQRLHFLSGIRVEDKYFSSPNLSGVIASRLARYHLLRGAR